MVCREVDLQGFYIQDVECEPDGIKYIAENWGSVEIIKPRWNGSFWEEGEPEKLKESILSQKKDAIVLIRDQILNSQMWIKQNHEIQIRNVARGRLDKTTLTEEQYDDINDYWDYLVALPDTVNYDLIELEDIRIDNVSIFGKLPHIENKLKKEA